jgi:hypothetical protein
VVAAVVVIGGAALALGGGGGGDDNGAGTSTTTSTTAPATSTSTATTLPAVAVGASGRGVRIDAITIKDGAYQVVYRTAGYDPKVSENPTTHHIHFFFDTVAQANAGTNGPKPGLWVLYDVPSPFTKYKVSDRPAGAQQMCALVADSHHGVETGTGNCLALPAA